MAVLISVIIPVYKDWKRLALCLEALGRQTIGAKNIQVIVVNNDPSGKKPDVKLPSFAQLLEERKPGSYAARNKAIPLAEGDYIAFTDSDCIPADNWLENALGILAQQPNARVTGPVSIFRTDATTHLAFLYEFHTAFRQEENSKKGVCVTANLITARQTLDKIGCFNEKLMSGGDFEWNSRATNIGVPLVYSKETLVYHPSRESLREIVQKRRRIARSDAVKSHHDTLRYIINQLTPPFRSLKSGRKYNSFLEVLLLWIVSWGLNLYSAGQFVAVRAKLSSPTRS